MQQQSSNLSNSIILFAMPGTWALGCAPQNRQSIDKIFSWLEKNENQHKGILVSNIRNLERLVPSFPDICYDLIELSTEPMTIVFSKANGIEKRLCYDDGSLGIQVTTNPILLKILNQFKNHLAFFEISAKLSHSIKSEYAQDLEIVETSSELIKESLSKILKIGEDSSIKIIRA